MSPRAACRLELLGFEEVYDYGPGKGDWLATGLARDGESVGTPYAGDLAHATVTCGPAELISDVKERVEKAGKDSCIVVDADDHVLGVVTAAALNGRGDEKAGDVADAAPQTFRANEPLSSFVEERSKKDVKTVLVTTPKGELLGVVEREELEEAVAKAKEDEKKS
jgi:signal-transduction protein with cAMP-binding, CBS, and nucleotidyltransferase domain